MRTRRRTIFKVLLLLAAGAALNVAVAWGHCIRESGPDQINLLGGIPLLGELFRPAEYGLPCKSLKINEHLVNGAVSQGRHAWNAGIQIDNPDWLIGTRSIALPICPAWPGFAINTLFYAGVLWMLLAGPFALRRIIRRRRGRCPACAYPIGQSPVCTECGAPHAVTVR